MWYDNLVVRYFELKTIIDANHNTTSSVVEFGREIPDKTRNRAVYIIVFSSKYRTTKVSFALSKIDK